MRGLRAKMEDYKITKNDDGVSFIVYDENMPRMALKTALKKFYEQYIVRILGDEEFFLPYGKTLYIKRFCNVNIGNIKQINLNYYGNWNSEECFFTLLTNQGDIFVSKDFEVKR